MCIPGTIMAAAGCSSVRNRKFKIQNEASLPDTLGHTFRFGLQLAKGTYERTCGRE